MSEVCKNLRDLKQGLNRFAPGLYVRVQGTTKHWVLKVQHAGRRREYGLGGVSELNITQAKAVAARLRLQLESGEEPTPPKRAAIIKERRRAEEAAKDAARSVTFAEFARDAIEHIRYIRKWTSEKHAAQWRTSVDRYAVPVIGQRPIKLLSTEDIVSVLKPIWETKTETAKRLQERLSVILSYAVTLKLLEDNPARWRGRLEHYLPSAAAVTKSGHHAAVDAETLKGVCETMFRNDCITSRAVLFGVLTALRTQEFCLLRWDEVDFERATATIPMGRRKDKKQEDFVVPLSKQALRCLEGIPRDSEFVFTSYTGKHIDKETPRVFLKRHCNQEITMHGCRSTFSDWCAQNGKNFLVSEKCLMHAVGGKVFMAYQRDDLLPLRRQLLQEWADFLLPNA